jgi:WD40 repeat protein
MNVHACHRYASLTGFTIAALIILASCASTETMAGSEPQGRVAGSYAAPASEPTIKVVTGISNMVCCIGFTPDGKRIVTGSNDTSLRVWDVETSKELRYFQGHNRRVSDLGISSDGKLAVTAGMWEGAVRLWDLERGLELHVFRMEDKIIPTATISPDGSMVAFGDEGGTIQIWSLRESVHLVRLLYTAGSPLSQLVFSPDGTGLAAISEDGALRIWSLVSWSTKTIKAHKAKSRVGGESKTMCVAYSPDGSHIATGGNDQQIAVWDAATGAQVWVKESGAGATNSVCFVPGKDILTSAHATGAIILWDSNSGERKRFFRDTSRAEEPWLAVAASADGSMLAAAGNGGSIRAWELDSLKKNFSVNTIDHIQDAELSPDGTSVACAFWTSAIIWNLAEARVMTAFDASVAGRWHVARCRVTNDGTFAVLVAADGGDGLALWDGKRLKSIAQFSGFTGNMERGAISPDGRLVAAATLQGPVYVWRIDSPAPLFTIKASISYSSRSLVFSPDSSLLAGVDGDNSVRVWEAGTGRKVCDIDCPAARAAFFTADSRKLLVCGWETASLYSTSGRLLSTLAGGYPRAIISACMMSPDGKTAFTGGEGWELDRWDTAARKITVSFIGQRGESRRTWLSADGARLVTLAWDHIIRVWNAATGELLYSAAIQGYNHDFLAWTPEGYYSGSERLARDLVYVQSGDEISSIDQYNELLYRPDLVAAKVQNGVLPDAARTATLPAIVARDGMPPKVEILEPAPGEVESRDVTLKLRVTQHSGGVGRIVVSLDGMPVVLSEGGRGLSVVSVPGSDASLAGEELEAHISLRGGNTTVEVSATNKAGSIESAKDSRQYRVPQGLEGKPRLVLLLVAVTKYRDGALRLTYPVDDAIAFKSAMLKSAAALYRDTSVIELFDSEATRDGLSQAFAKAGELAGAQDTFVLYFAGHGVANEADGEYYFLPADFRYRDQASITAQGISKKQILEDLMKVTAEKSILLFDTCNSGSFLATPASRGLTEKTAVDRLKRAIGRAMIVASSDTQVALEGYKGHGVFTYALVDGLSGKADGDRNGYVSVKELSTYVENAVPELTYSTWGYEQLPQSLLPREDFPLAQDVSP